MPSKHDEAVHARLAHAETAVKLDPTFEDAIVQYIRALSMECSLSHRKWDHRKATDIAERILSNALQYFDRFGTRAKYRHEFQDACSLALAASLRGLDTSMMALPSVGCTELTPQRLRIVQMAKRVLEDAVTNGEPDAGVIQRNPTTTIYSRAVALTIVGRTMKLTGVPLAERQKWVDGILQQFAESEAEMPKITDDIDARTRLRRQCQGDMFRLDGDELWLRAAELAVDDACLDRAWKLIVQLQHRFRAPDRQSMISVGTRLSGRIPFLRMIVLRMDDAERLAEFDRRSVGSMGSAGQNLVSRMQLRWPSADVFQDRQKVSNGRYNSVVPPAVEGVVIRRAPMPDDLGPMPIHPLAEGNGRLYVTITCNHQFKRGKNTLNSPSQVIGYLPLDGTGRPVGNTFQLSKYPRKEFWDSIKLLPQPENGKMPAVFCAKYVAGRLYLGVSGGLMVFDPGSEKWMIYGPELGLPAKAISSFCLLDEHTLYCVGSNSFRHPVCYTLELPEGKVTLFHRAKEALDDPGPQYFWHDGDKLFAWGLQGLYRDLSNGQLKFTRCECGRLTVGTPLVATSAPLHKMEPTASGEWSKWPGDVS